MKLPLATVATLVAVLIAHEGALVAAGPTGADTTVPNDASAPAFVEQERGVASDAFPAYCPRIITSSFLKKGRAALDYTGLWKKKLDPKDETVEKVADWLSVRLAYARMGHNYTDPTLARGSPSFTIWVPPVRGLAPIANPVSNYQATGINQLAFINGVAKHYKKKPVYINLDQRVLGQPAGQTLVSVLNTCFGGAVTGVPRLTYGAPDNRGYPSTNQYNDQPAANFYSGHREDYTDLGRRYRNGEVDTFQMPNPQHYLHELQEVNPGAANGIPYLSYAAHNNEKGVDQFDPKVVEQSEQQPASLNSNSGQGYMPFPGQQQQQQQPQQLQPQQQPQQPQPQQQQQQPQQLQPQQQPQQPQQLQPQQQQQQQQQQQTQQQQERPIFPDPQAYIQ